MIGTILFSILIWMIGLILAALGCILLFRLRKKIKNRISGKVEPYHFSDKEMEKVSGCFVNREEKYVASLGNGYIANFLANGGLKKGFAILSDKRVYFKGTCLTGTGRHLTKTNEERTVDNTDVTGSGFTFHRSYLRFICVILAAVAILAAGVGVLFSDIIDGPHFDRFALENWKDYVFYRYSYQKKEVQSIKEDLELLRSLGECDADGEYNYPYGPNHFELTEKHIGLLKRFANYLEYMSGDDLRKIDKRLTDELYWEERYRDDELYNARWYATIFAIGFAVSVLSVPIFSIAFLFLKDRKTYFEIQYAGGRIAFDVSFYAKAEIDEFQKQLRLAKDRAAEQVKQATSATPEQKPVKTASQTPAADTSETLMKYAEMLKNGLISQEEYDTLKKNRPH